ncbi:MAG: hypothetical protein A2287_10130 [Candidatus Melainabacteria bacterium RIFOXYA12_FULL_32_12]|nr:MAG: hypothetical protein A2287_10130 [Candidatus Melainabacteria bacterium RIFOXYA12_FULL_32_12]
MVALMTLAVLTFELIFLAIGLGVGYWLVVTALKQEGGIKTAGLIFGWLLIVMAFLITLTNCIVSIQNWRSGYMMGSPTMQQMMEQRGGMPMNTKQQRGMMNQ